MIVRSSSGTGDLNKLVICKTSQPPPPPLLLPHPTHVNHDFSRIQSTHPENASNTNYSLLVLRKRLYR